MTLMRKGERYMSIQKFYRNTAAGLLAALFLSAAGCSSTTSVFPSAKGNQEELEESETGQKDTVGEAGEPENSGDGAKEITTGDAGEPEGSKDGTETEIYVDVTGAVNSPGVYTLPAGSRVFEAISLAGGAREDASLENLNQAGILEDGQQIRVYTEEEAEQMARQGTLPGTQAAEQNEGQKAAKVNINTAGKEELMTLTGIGETRAEAILAYRQEAGGFQAPEDLMQVEGIKEKTFEKLKDQITVN